MRVGILSFAHLHADSYLKLLKAHPDVEFIGLADENAARGKHFAQLYGARLFESYDQLLEEKPDAVVIASENARHRKLVTMAASAGAHVLCEKPLATKLTDARAIVRACKQAGVTLMTAFPMRFNAPIIEAKKVVDSGKLGKIYGSNGTNQGSLPVYHVQGQRKFRGWFLNKRLAGGGAVIDHTVHLADVFRWLFKSEVTEVYAQTHNLFARGNKISVETGGLVMMTFANGAFATIDCSWSRPPYYPYWGNLKFELVAEYGLVTVNALGQVGTVYSDAAQRPRWNYWGSNSDEGMLAEFISAVKEQRPPLVTGEDGLKAVEITLAAYQSAETGQPVSLPLK